MPALRDREDVQFAAVCRIGADELQRVKNEFGFEVATEEFEKLLEIPDLDGAIVSFPHGFHYEHAIAALRRGLHVMCEKPLTTNSDHARELVAEAKRQGVQLLMPHGWHYSPFVQQAKERIDRGEEGTVEFVQCHMASPLRGLLTGGKFEYNAANMFMAPESETRADPNIAGGGYGFSQMTHSATMLYWLTGLSPQKVFAVMSALGSQVELYHAMSVQFDGDVIGSFSGAGTVPADRDSSLISESSALKAC